MTPDRTELDEIRPPEPPKPQRSGWRWVRRAAITLGVIVLVVGLLIASAWQSVRSRGIAQRDQAVAELDAAEPGWRLADLTAVRMQNQPPPDENVCDLAKRVHGLKSKAWQDWQARPHIGETLDPSRRSSDADLELARAVLRSDPDKFALARRAHTCRGSAAVNWDAPNPFAILLPHCDHLRQTAAVLDLDALLAAHEGRGDDALDAALGILALTRGINDEPTLISQLVRIAITNIAIRSVERTLGLTEAGDAKLAEFQAAVAAEADQPRLLWGLRGERGLSYKLGDGIDSGAIDARGLFDGTANVPSAAFRVAASSITPGAQAVFLETMNRSIAAARLPVGPKRTDELKAAEKWLLDRDDLEAKVVRQFIPAMMKCSEADTGCAALCRAATVAMACERFRLKHGHFPNSLDELPKDLLAAVPNDPYTGEPLKYTTTDTGAVVYCTGPDKTDDGGKLNRGGSSRPGNDVGFAGYAPAHRRQPSPGADAK